MAEATLSTIGAVVNVIQIGDAAIRLCRSIATFIRELKDAKDDMRYLGTTLDDTNSLMRNLIVYIREFQNAPSTSEQYEVLPEVVVATVHNFHESLKSLRRWLPPDLSPNFAQRFRFVFNRKKIQSASLELEKCKNNTSVALLVISSLHTIKLRDDVRCLRISSETTAAEQKLALQDASQQTSQLLTKIQDISERQTRAFPPLGPASNRTSDVLALLQSIYTTVTAQSNSPEHQRSTETFVAGDEETLAKIVRAYLTETVNMRTTGMDRDEMSKVDGLSIGVASQAYLDDFFGSTEATTTTAPATICRTQRSHYADSNVGSPIQRRDSTQKPSVILFRKFMTIRLRWVIIHLLVIGLRHRQTNIQNSAPCFSITIDLVPQRFFSSGVSLSYTNTPDHAGYYSICPAVLTFNIIPAIMEREIDRALYNDDADRLQRMIMNREVGVRDRDRQGHSLLTHALKHSSAKCVRYLMSGTGLSQSAVLDVLNTTESSLGKDFMKHIYRGVLFGVFPLSRVFDCAHSILDNDVSIDSHEEGVANIWDAMSDTENEDWEKCRNKYMEDLYWKRHFAHVSEPLQDNEVQTYVALKKIGFSLEFFSWRRPCEWPGWANNLLYHEFCMELCLKVGEDPNAPLKLRNENRPLEHAVRVLAQDNDQTTDARHLGAFESKPIKTSPRLLVLLINAGADIFFTREVDGQIQSISDLAHNLGIGHLWEAALAECGHDPRQVKVESERRKMVDKKLQSAYRSGIDIESIKKVPYTQGLRYRPAAKTARTEVSIAN
ncbi:hypothetical protein F5B19DRAFT_500489 [Rostrohypoxylon terebratum]|nr:hypothetical protein F5B19DRAFT_500489 [Rostrohypoxylon terebratum]